MDEEFDMRQSERKLGDVGEFLEKVGLEGELKSEGLKLDPSSEAARRSDVYRRSLARACLSELSHRRAA